MNLEIQKDVPLPKKMVMPVKPKGSGTKWAPTVIKMEVNDCVIVPDRFAANAFRVQGRLYGFKMVQRKQGNGSYKVWRKS